MIRYKDKIFEDFFIDIETGLITDKNGIVQETWNHDGYLMFKEMPIHRIQVYTAYGNYDSSIYDVHHNDENKLNNALSNLILLDSRIHRSISKKGTHHHNYGKMSPMKGKHHSEDTKEKMSAAKKGKTSPFKGKHHTDEAKAKNRAAHKGVITGSYWWNNGLICKICKDCPGEGWVRGRI